MDNVHNATNDSHKWLWQATEQVFTGCRTKEYTNGQVYYGQVFTHFVSLHLSAADTMVSIKTTTIVLRPFVRDYLGEPVPEETLTQPTILIIIQSLPASSTYGTMIHTILLVQIACLAIFLHNLSSRPLWSTSWSGALHLIFCTYWQAVNRED